MTDLEGVGWGCLREDAEKRCSGLVTGPSLSAAATLAAEPLQAWPQHRRRYIHESTWLFWHSVMSSHPQSCYGHVIKHFTQYDSEDKPHHSIVILISRDGEKGCNLITKMKYLRFKVSESCHKSSRKKLAIPSPVRNVKNFPGYCPQGAIENWHTDWRRWRNIPSTPRKDHWCWLISSAPYHLVQLDYLQSIWALSDMYNKHNFEDKNNINWQMKKRHYKINSDRVYYRKREFLNIWVNFQKRNVNF